MDCQPMSLSTLLRNRIDELEMSISDLARRSGVSRATVIRILGGKDEHYSVSNLQAVLFALGMKIDLSAIPAKRFIDSIATQKAKRLIALTQGNVALESQAVSPASAQEYLEATKARIASSSRKLWAS
jgi:transcriptional regulator with XRE-family HTH domain